MPMLGPYVDQNYYLAEFWAYLPVTCMQLEVKLHKLIGVFSSVWFHPYFSIVGNSSKYLSENLA